MKRLDQQLARVRSSPGISLLRVSQKGDAGHIVRHGLQEYQVYCMQSG